MTMPPLIGAICDGCGLIRVDLRRSVRGISQLKVIARATSILIPKTQKALIEYPIAKQTP